jgi:ribosomal protein S9
MLELPFRVRTMSAWRGFELREASAAIAHRKQYARSKLSNDTAMLQGVDQRTGPGRRFKDIVRAVIADQGGSDVIAEVRLQLIRRFAAEACLAEALEARMALGAEIDIIEHCQLAGTMSRIAARIGINRVLKDAQTLDQYIAKAPAAEIDEEAISDAD